MKIFDNYARYYDILYKDKDYQLEAEYVIAQINRFAPKAKTVLELGCGTGIHAQYIAQAGYTVTGIDFSETMLKLAVSRRLGLPTEIRDRIELTQGDIRSYQGLKPVDVVLSIFHVFCYQTSNADLNGAFKTAMNNLNPGGILLFDYWYGPAVLAQRPETRVKRMNDAEVSILRIAESELDDKTNTVVVNYETIVKHKQSFNTLHESHRVRYLFTPEIELLANMHGFEPVAHLAWLGDGVPSNSTWAALSILKKPI